MNIETLDVLMDCPLFSGISREEIVDVMHKVRYRIVNYHRGDLVAMAGAPCLYAEIVLSGEVVASMMGPSGRIIQITKRYPGNMLAPAFLFAKDNRYPVTVEATKETKVFRLLYDDMIQLMASEPRLAMNYTRIVSNIVGFLTKKVGMLSMNVREKITLFLKEECQRQQTNRVFVKMSRQELANYFGIQKYSLQRCLKSMQDDCVIKIDGKYIIVIDK